MFKTWLFAAIKLGLLLILLVFGGTWVFNDGLKNLSATSDIYMLLGIAEVSVVAVAVAVCSWLGVGIVKKAAEKQIAKENTNAK